MNKFRVNFSMGCQRQSSVEEADSADEAVKIVKARYEGMYVLTNFHVELI